MTKFCDTVLRERYPHLVRAVESAGQDAETDLGDLMADFGEESVSLFLAGVAEGARTQKNPTGFEAVLNELRSKLGGGKTG